MTDEELNEIEKRANAADPAPWTYNNHSIYWNAPNTPSGETITDGIHEHDPSGEIVDSFRNFSRIDNAKFIAHSREDIPKLIAKIRHLKAYVEILKADLTIMHIALGSAKQSISQTDAEVTRLKETLYEIASSEYPDGFHSIVSSAKEAIGIK